MSLVGEQLVEIGARTDPTPGPAPRHLAAVTAVAEHVAAEGKHTFSRRLADATEVHDPDDGTGEATECAR